MPPFDPWTPAEEAGLLPAPPGRKEAIEAWRVLQREKAARTEADAAIKRTKQRTKQRGRDDR